ncbi:hypothetical protein ACFE04_008320 [Oxalis oulophora]
MIEETDGRRMREPERSFFVRIEARGVGARGGRGVVKVVASRRVASHPIGLAGETRENGRLEGRAKQNSESRSGAAQFDGGFVVRRWWRRQDGRKSGFQLVDARFERGHAVRQQQTRNANGGDEDGRAQGRPAAVASDAVVVFGRRRNVVVARAPHCDAGGGGGGGGLQSSTSTSRRPTSASRVSGCSGRMGPASGGGGGGGGGSGGSDSGWRRSRISRSAMATVDPRSHVRPRAWRSNRVAGAPDYRHVRGRIYRPLVRSKDAMRCSRVATNRR